MSSTMPPSFAVSCSTAMSVLFAARHFEQFQRVAHVAVQVAQRDHDAFQRLALAADFLRALGVIPQRGVLAQLDQFLEAAGFRVVVKDTSATPRRVPRGRAGGWRWR